jgi:hypothetical protein
MADFYTVFFNPDTNHFAILEHGKYLREYSKHCPAEIIKVPYHRARSYQVKLNKELSNGTKDERAN